MMEHMNSQHSLGGTVAIGGLFLLFLSSCLGGPGMGSLVGPVLRDGDRVALVGNTFIEREADSSYIETALLLSHPEARLVFRNFGWSGDTVAAASRGYFKPQEGYRLLLESVTAAKPTVIILGYGANAAWDGPEGVDAFRTSLCRLIDDLAKRTAARFILISPLAQEAFEAPYPDPDKHNVELARYTVVIKSVAVERGAAYIDLFSTVRAPNGEHWTSNSIHLTPEGYQQAAAVVVKAFGKSPTEFAGSGALRRIVIAKNEQFFHSWRPENTTYLFGFRKHEQGNNAVEVARIRPFVERFDAQIQASTIAIAAGETPVLANITKQGAGFRPSGHRYVREAAVEQQAFQVPDDLQVTLFAAEPMVVNPTNMNWDARGRLWVASAPMYPHVKPGHKATDRILVLEDTDGDGKADKSTVFAEGLLIPTLVLPGDGGVYVGNSTEMIHLKDTDGDGKADEKRIVMSGFGTEDTHHILHTPRWGQDGLMYFNQSIYIHSHVETPWGVSRLMAGGTWQFEPRTGKMRVVSRGLVNSWGQQMDDWGQSFATDGAGGAGINYIFPGVAAVTAYGTRHLLKGMNPGQPKLCGLEILSGTHLPERYRGLLAANDFRGHRTTSFRLSKNGSGYASKPDVDLISIAHRGYDPKGKRGAFRPVDVKMGPDGAIYVADWSNIIIQHGEVDFRDDRRDHENGRIWRISAKGKPALKAPPIAGAPVAQLIQNLDSPERWVVSMSKRELIERGPDVLPAVRAWESRLRGAHAERLRLHALWLHVGLDYVDMHILKRCLASRDGRVRAAAIRAVRHSLDRIPGAFELLVAAIADGHPRVRLEALHALRDVATTRAAELAVQVLDQEMDDVLDYTLVLTLRELEPQWAGKTAFDGKVSHVAFAIEATGNRAPITGLFEALQAGKIPSESRDDVLLLIARLGNREQVGTLFKLATGDALPAATRARVFAAMAKAVVERKVRPTGDLKPLARVIASTDGTVLSAAARLAGRLRLVQALEALKRVVLTPDRRHGSEVLQAIGDIGGGSASVVLQHLVEHAPSPELRIGALANLVRVDRAAAGSMAVALFNALPATTDPSPVFDAFYRQADGPAALSKAISGATVSARVAQAGVRRATTAGRDLGEHVRVLSVAGGLKSMKQKLTAAEMKAVIARVAASGNPVIGERIYRRQSLLCVSCHAIGGAGSPIGPDLISIGASAPVDYIIESLLNPSAKIKEGYHMTVATMRDGSIIAGSQLSDADGKLVLRDATGKEHTLAKKQMESSFVSPTSLMPPALTVALQPEEFAHLVAFMSQLGKPGKFRLPKAQFVRSFTVLESDATKSASIKPEAVAKNPDLSQWRVAFALVNGSIPLDDASVFGDGDRFLRFAIEVTTPGRVDLRLANGKHVKAWRNGDAIKFRRGNARLNLGKGSHDIVFYIGASNRAPSISVEMRDVRGSKAVSRLRQTMSEER